LLTIPHSSFVKASPRFEFLDSSKLPWEGICLVHGGAWDIPATLQDAHQNGVCQAYETLLKKTDVLSSQPLYCVTEVLASLENDPTFDAGFGSFLNERGEVEMDAGVMEGQNLRAGAVAALGAFSNPGKVALAVLEHSDHVLLAGEGANAFALRQGFKMVPPRSLVHPREQLAFENWIAAGKPHAQTFFANSVSLAGADPEKRGTVGVVLALRQISKSNNQFDLYCGTSTGGTPGKMWGRVGDVPIPGAGFYADNEGACVSATGWGEAFLRTLPCKSVSDLCASGVHPQEACERVLKHMLRRTDGRGGLIAISKKGECGAAFTTPDMAMRGQNCTKVTETC
jgi:L-asparaginase / beta-aspartyl-peptidase